MAHTQTHPAAAPAKAAPLYPRLALPKLEACFPDGSLIWLHQVGVDPLTRRLEVDGELLEVDLRTIDPTLHASVFEAPRIDQPGVIFFTLRRHFASAAAFVARVRGVLQ